MVLLFHDNNRYNIHLRGPLMSGLIRSGKSVFFQRDNRD